MRASTLSITLVSSSSLEDRSRFVMDGHSSSPVTASGPASPFFARLRVSSELSFDRFSTLQIRFCDRFNVLRSCIVSRFSMRSMTFCCKYRERICERCARPSMARSPLDSRNNVLTLTYGSRFSILRKP